MHVADVELLDGHAALHETESILRVLDDQEDVLTRSSLVDDIDGLLDGEIARGNALRGCHVHELLAHRVRRDVVICDEQQVGANRRGPLGSDLPVDQAVVDTREDNVWFSHV